MKTFVIVAAIACLAVIYTEITQINAQEDQRCDPQPELKSPSEVKCDRRPILNLLCRAHCRRCYSREELSDKVGCLVDGKCVCLGDSNSTTTTSTTTMDPSQEPTSTPESTTPEATTESQEVTTVTESESTTV